MNMWTVVIILLVIAAITGTVIYFDWANRQKQKTASERLGSGIGDVVTAIAQFIGGARL